MNIKDFKKINIVLDDILKETEKELLKLNIQRDSEDWDNLILKSKEGVLREMGFTLEEYNHAKDSFDLLERAKQENLETLGKTLSSVLKEEVEKISNIRTDVENVLSEVNEIKLKVPTQEEVDSLLKKLIKEHIKEVTVEKEIVKIIEKPTIVKETIVEREEYDDSEIKKDIDEAFRQIQSVAETKPQQVIIEKEKSPKIDIKKIKEEILSETNANIKDSIDTLGMPNFRKLGMGLQAQIDSNHSSISNSLALQFPWNINYQTLYKEFTRNVSDQVTQIDYWDTSLKATKLYEKEFNRTGDTLTSIVLTDLISGKIYTKTFNRTGDVLDSITSSIS